MKALLIRIRILLRSRRNGQLLTRAVSLVAAIVVFVTTYALVLPAITLEQEAYCGILEHQHTDTCYEERLVCEIPEGEDHHHDASCYEKVLVCGQEVHIHSPECYQEDSIAVVSAGSETAAFTDFGTSAEVDEIFTEADQTSVEPDGTFPEADQTFMDSDPFSGDGSDSDADTVAADSYAAADEADGGMEESAQETVPDDFGNSSDLPEDMDQENPAGAGGFELTEDSSQNTADSDMEAIETGSSEDTDAGTVDADSMDAEDSEAPGIEAPENMGDEQVSGIETSENMEADTAEQEEAESQNIEEDKDAASDEEGGSQGESVSDENENQFTEEENSSDVSSDFSSDVNDWSDSAADTSDPAPEEDISDEDGESNESNDFAADTADAGLEDEDTAVWETEGAGSADIAAADADIAAGETEDAGSADIATEDENTAAGEAEDAGSADIAAEDADTVVGETEDAGSSDTETADADTAAGLEETANEAATDVPAEPVEAERLSAGYVPQLDSIVLGSMLNKHTDFYYFHAEEGQEIPATSAEVTDWKKVKNGLFGSTKLETGDLVKAYFSYTIPAGALNETNQVARYRLPSNIHLTDDQITAINGTENGMTAIYADAANTTDAVADADEDTVVDTDDETLGESPEMETGAEDDSTNLGDDGTNVEDANIGAEDDNTGAEDAGSVSGTDEDDKAEAVPDTENPENGSPKDAGFVTDMDEQDVTEDASDSMEPAQDDNTSNYQKYLGAEAVEGSRTPDEKLKEGAQEYISAIVKVENVFDEEGLYGEKGAYLGQDLIFIFTPYSIEKNQTTYDADGNPISAGEKITGWFACDFNMSQIDWVEEDTDLDKSTIEKTAEVVFVEKDSDNKVKEISRTLKLVDVNGDQSDTAQGGETAAAAETAAVAETAGIAATAATAAETAATASETAATDEAAKDTEDTEAGSFKSGTLTADGDGYKITLDYTEEAKIPENAELSVREITPETDREAYEACLEQAGQQVAADDKTSVDRKASRFFDIEILVKETDSEGKEETRKIEPSAPVSVNIQIIESPEAEDATSGDEKTERNDPAVLHFAEEGVEQIDSTVKTSQEQDSKEVRSGNEETEPATEISFEAESFSIYGVVYTVDFEYSVNGKMYQFSLPGGGFVSFTDLVEVLGITHDTNAEENGDENGSVIAESDEENAEENAANEGAEENGVNAETNAPLTLGDVEVSEETRNFVADVAYVEFSSLELVDVSKVDSDTTVGQIKEDRGLECQYSTELTEEQIAEINAQTVEAGDWALISVQPFTSEEILTVTMKNGEVFTIRVTDYQLSTNVLTADGQTYKITVTYDDDAEIPDGTKLVASEIEPGTDEYIQHLGQAWTEVNKEYFEVEEKRENYDESMGELPDVPYTNINAARFFDISLIYNNEEIEPKAPVQVEISYVQGLEAWEEATPGVAHYVSGTQVEIIEDVDTTIQDHEVTSFRYEQESFSGVGTYVAQEIQDSYVEPKLAAAPDPNGSAKVKSANMTNEALDEVVRSSLKSSDLLRAGETEQSDENDHTDLDKPEAHKTLTPNTDDAGVEDGTYTLTLSVKGHSSITTETQQKKSNVLVVMDRSSSMITKTVSDDETFWYYGTANTAVFRQDIGDPTHNTGKNYHFYGVVNGEYVELNANFTGWNTVNFTYWDGTYETWMPRVYNPSTGQWEYPKHYVSYPADAPLYMKSAKTRMVAEQEALSTLFGELMEMNDATGVNKDMVEISVISFGDERNNNKSWRDETEVDWQSGRNTSTLMNGVLSNRFTSGTNWEEALQYAYSVISAKKTAEENAGKTNEDYYVVFLTDGEPTNSVNHSGGNTAWAGNDTQRMECYDAAKDDAKKLVDEGYNFYNIFTFRQSEDEKYSIYLSNYAYGEGNYKNDKDLAVSHNYSDAKTIDDLRDALKNIFFTIEDSIGHGNVSITDTLTTDAMTTTVVHGKTNGYVYEVKDGSGTLLYTVTATGDLSDPTVVFNVPASSTKDYTATASTVGEKTVYSVTTDEGKVYKMALADVNDTTGELVWDLSPIGLLLDNCTYSVNFVVWPDQDAYDYVAALNNGLETVTDSSNNTVNVEWKQETATPVTGSEGTYYKGGCTKYPSIVYYPGEGDDYEHGVYNGNFAVLTNTNQTLHYSVIETKTENGTTSTEITGPFYHDLETPDPMPLTKTKSNIEKMWNVERDPGILAQLLYKTDGSPTKFFIDFGILQDDDGTTIDDDEANTYTTVRLGWDETVDNGDGTHGAYVWDTTDPSYVKTVLYNGKQCVVGTRWASDFSIATGLMLSDDRMDDLGLDKTAYPTGTFNGTKYYILEEGHDFTITEPGLSYDFDFAGPTYHPMLVDGVLRSVDVDYTKDDDGKITDVNITGMTSAEVDLSSLKIENTLRGYINLDKVVVGTDGVTPVENDNTKFEYRVILENATVPGPFTTEGHHVPWYGISGLYYHTIDNNGNFQYYQAETNTEDNQAHSFVLTTESGKEYTAWCSDSEGNEAAQDVLFDEDVPGPTWITYNDGTQDITLQLYGNQMDRSSDNYVSASIQSNQKQTLNIANVPVGSTYEITELDENGYEFVKAVREIKKDPDTEAESSDTVTTKTVTGTIVEDRDNHITYTNKSQTTSIEVQKIWDTPEGLPSGTADMVLYKVVGKKAEDLEEGEIDPARPSQKIRITVNANLLSELTGESVGVSDSAYIDIEYEGTSSGSYRLSNETGWQHTFEFDRGGTYSFTYTVDGVKVKSVTPEESEVIDNSKTIQLNATVEHVPQYEYTFTVPQAERQYRGGILVTFNGEEKTANADNNWTVSFSVARESSVNYSASPINGFIDSVTLDPTAAEGEQAVSNKTVNMHPNYAATTLSVPVTVNWDKTPPSGTSVIIDFIPDKENVSHTSLTLNGDGSWFSLQELDRLDENGELITWTVATNAASTEEYNVSVSLLSPEGATISDTASDVIVNGTAARNTMTVPISVSWGSSTPDAGTTVKVTFTNDTNTEIVTLNGSEPTAWTKTKTLPRLDASGNLLTWTVSTEVVPADSFATVSGAPASVSDDDGDGTTNAVALTGSVNRTMNLTVKTTDGVNIGGFYKATIVNGNVYYSTSDSAGELSGWNGQTKTFEGLDVQNEDGADQYYAILLWEGNVDTRTDLLTAGYTISAMENYNTWRTVVYFKAETGNKTIEMTKDGSTSGKVFTGQIMRSVNHTAKATIQSSRSLLRSKKSSESLRASVIASPTQTFYDPSANTSTEAEGKVKFEVVQFKDLPEGAEVVAADGDGKSGTQTVTGNNTCTWSNLPNQDEDGNPIYYYIVEKQATAQADTMSVAYSYVYNNDGTISKVIITNTTTGTPTPTKGDITVTKSFEGLGEEVTLPDDFKITNSYDDQEFTVSNATGTNPYTWILSGVDGGTTVTFTESGATVNGYNLTVTSSGTIIEGAAVSATVIAGETVTASFVNTYEQKTIDVILKKVDKANISKTPLESSDLLDGAKFILEKYTQLSPVESKDTVWNEAHNEQNAGTGGVFTFTDLPVGIYKIVEKEYPKGYVHVTTDPVFEVVVDEDTGELRVQIINDSNGLVRLDDKNELIIIVGNEPGVALPNTGGPGTRFFTILGSILILGAGVLLWRRRRLI